jgi:hypothetical protein
MGIQWMVCWSVLVQFAHLLLYSLWISQQAWVATVEVGMATWKAINSLRPTRDPTIQARLDQAFKAEWCHLGIFGADCVTIVWCFLPPLYFLNFSNV